jgi:hypothetical protein
MADTFRDIPGDTKDNYLQLQQSTGETFGSMADRIEHPAQLQYQDDNGKAAAKRLAGFLRAQTDDGEALARFAAPAAPISDNDGPKGRQAGGGKVTA